MVGVPSTAISKRVLIVDDEALVRWALHEELRTAGHSVVEANALSDAWPVIHDMSQPLDVAVVDACLPDGNGLQLLTSVMRHRPDCAVIMISAYWGAHEEANLLKMGARHVLVKPFDVPALVRMVATCGTPAA